MTATIIAHSTGHELPWVVVENLATNRIESQGPEGWLGMNPTQGQLWERIAEHAEQVQDGCVAELLNSILYGLTSIDDE